jgi:hypothetical protein
VKYLYNIGCSFSEGNGIGEDKGLSPGSDEFKKLEAKSRYSAILSDKLGLTEINEAKGGGSNQRIFRKTWNWIAENPKLLSETLFVIQWAYPIRSEYYDGSREGGKKWYNMDTEGLIKKEHYHDNTKLVDFKVPDIETSFRITVRYILSLQSFFKEHRVNFIFFEGDTTHPQATIDLTSDLGKLVDLNHWILESFLPFSGKELTKNGHPSAKSQIKWAEKLEKFIKDKNWLS